MRSAPSFSLSHSRKGDCSTVVEPRRETRERKRDDGRNGCPCYTGSSRFTEVVSPLIEN